MADALPVGGPSVFATPRGTMEVGGGNAPALGAPPTQPTGTQPGAAADAVMAVAKAAAAVLAAQSLPGAGGTRAIEAFDLPPDVFTDTIRMYCWIAALVGMFFLLSALALAFAFGLGWWVGKRAALSTATS